ncbi:hypothetical protein [Actinacidiphila sp. bgisy160]|uniref:hypothetical protein n=1 Tax=Actinacidiphila sp. bgisy160 TaxID=3413796 RepID=UPI003D702439
MGVWLITWPRGTSTELHDHAGSLGALTVVGGTLTDRGHDRVATRELAAGGGAAATPAVSVHTYSPPPRRCPITRSATRAPRAARVPC